MSRIPSAEELQEMADAPRSATMARHRPLPGRVEPPRPLFRKSSNPDPYPVDKMGPILAPATEAIIRLTQAPAGICANSVLAAASLATQALADVKIPGTERAHPLSLYLLTIAESGERKTTADREALIGVKNRETELRELAKEEISSYRNSVDAYDAARAEVLKRGKGDLAATRNAFDSLGAAPAKPTLPVLTITEPTVEGLVKFLVESQPTIGLFTSEGGSFLGGHAMSDEARLRSAARLSSLWDGEKIDRIRAGDGSIVIAGKRVAMHIMAQPEAASRFLADPTLRDQGLLSRFLISSPIPTAGTRMFRPGDLDTQQAIYRFAERVEATLRAVVPADAEGTRPALELTAGARTMFIRWHDEVETSIAPGGILAPIKGFASKLAEHSARIAGVLTLIADRTATAIDERAMAGGIALANHYAGEMLRLAAEARVPEQLRVAERLRAWLDERNASLIHVSEVYQFGPAELRSKADALGAIRILEDHGYLLKLDGGAEIDGRKRRDVWRFIRGEVVAAQRADIEQKGAVDNVDDYAQEVADGRP